MKSGFPFDAAGWAELGYGSCGRRDRGRGRFWATGGVTHVLVSQHAGVRGVCCPTWEHDVGLWCRLPSSTLPADGAAVAAADDDAAGKPALFVEADLATFIVGEVGADWLARAPSTGGYAELRDTWQKEATGDALRSETEYERRRQAFTHRLTFRIRYRASGERALSKSDARDAQLALRTAIGTISGLPVMLT